MTSTPGAALATRMRLIVTADLLVLAIRNAVTLSGGPTIAAYEPVCALTLSGGPGSVARNVSASTTAAIGIRNAASDLHDTHARTLHTHARDVRRSRKILTLTPRGYAHSPELGSPRMRTVPRTGPATLDPALPSARKAGSRGHLRVAATGAGADA